MSLLPNDTPEEAISATIDETLGVERRSRVWLKVSLAIIGLAILLALVIVFKPKDAIVNTMHEIRSYGVWGAVIVSLLYIPMCVLLIPCSLMTMFSGYAFGVIVGTIAVSLGSTVGASASFGVGRLVARRLLAHRLLRSPRFVALDRAVSDNGFRVVMLTRLSPVMPFNLLSYTYSLTSVRFRDYFLGSWIGMFPSTLMYVYIGSTCASLTELGPGQRAPTTMELVLFWGGLAVTLIVTVILTRIARRALSDQLARGGRSPDLTVTS